MSKNGAENVLFEEGYAVARMSKKMKEENAFFLNERGRMAYYDKCRKCERDCKQSFRILDLYCPHVARKRGR